ncbi:PLP-dependent aminotransferase family protein [Orlajensenia flava]|nr:PLP-dependent aminotransferase family protein [Glaciibacter flavus]
MHEQLGDPSVPLDRARQQTLSDQVAVRMREAILSGRAQGGDAVPSSRALAGALGVSRGVVVRAFEHLAGEGYLDVSQGSVARVAVVDRSASPRRRRSLPDSPTRASARIDLLPGFPSMTRLDEGAWRAAWRSAAARAVPSAETDDRGLLRLREQIAEHVRHARGVSCDASDVLVTAGTSEAIMLLTLAIRSLRPGDPAIAVEDPGYPATRRAIVRFGGSAVGVPVDDDGMRVDLLEAIDPAPHAVVLTPSHQYPLGGRLPVSARVAVLDWAERHDALVIEDDYDSEFRHGAPVLPALASLDRGERVALVGSFSKVLTPWLRLGYILLPRRTMLHEAIRRIRDDATCPVPGIAQEAIADLLESGAVRRHIAAARRDYAHRRGLVIAALGGLPGTRLTGLDGGLHAVLTLESADAAARVRNRSRAAGVAVADLADYTIDETHASPGLVIGYAAPTDTALAEGLAVLRAAVLAERGRE